LIVLTNVI